MATECERKFLVEGKGWESPDVSRLTQGYIPLKGTGQIRVRQVGEDRAYLTLKSAKSGFERDEFEYPIPVSDAEKLLRAFCISPLIMKKRHRTQYAGSNWEIDVYGGANEGLIVAEIELETPDSTFERPPWLGLEITEDVRFSNENLVRRPFREWNQFPPPAS